MATILDFQAVVDGWNYNAIVAGEQRVLHFQEQVSLDQVQAVANDIEERMVKEAQASVIEEAQAAAIQDSVPI